MKTCKNCGRYPFCEEEVKQNCDKWRKQEYTKLTKIDGDIKIIERIEE